MDCVQGPTASQDVEEIPYAAGMEDFVEIPEGLRWECMMCGSCCGNVFSETWMDAALREYVGEPVDGHCRYLDVENSKRCNRYESRPAICRGYPFVIRRKGDRYILSVHSKCPGMGCGELVDVRERMRYTLELIEDSMDIDFIVNREDDGTFSLYRIK